MTKRGRKPKAIVIHNDAGTMNSKQYYNNLVNADYNRLARGIAHAYADRNGIWEAISEDRIAWHVSDGVQPGSGNFETYGIEVNQSLYVSDKDFLKMNKQLLNSQRMKLKSGGYQLTEILFVYTTNLVIQLVLIVLLNCILVLIQQNKHGLKATQLKLKDYFIKQIRAYMKGDTPKVTTVKNKPGSASTPANRRDMNGWKINKYGTYYKSEKVHLLLILQLSQDVLVHLLRPQSGVLQAGQSIIFDTECLQDGFRWLSYTAYDGTDIWLPISTWNKTNDSLGNCGDN